MVEWRACGASARRLVTAAYWVLTSWFMVPLTHYWVCAALWPIRQLWPPLHRYLYDAFAQHAMAHYGYFVHTQGFRIDEYGDDVSSVADRRCLVLANHQSANDNPVLVNAFTKHRVNYKALWLVYGWPPFKYNPLGISWMLHGYYFIRGSKSEHKRTKMLHGWKRHLNTVYPANGFKWICLYPEGGFYTAKQKSKCNAYAERHGYPLLEHTLLPRSAGAFAAIQAVKGNLDAIVDITVAYEDQPPPTTLQGLMPTRDTYGVHLKYKIHELHSVPTSSEPLFRAWLHRLWGEKDALLADFRAGGPSATLGEGGRRIEHGAGRIYATEAVLCAAGAMCAYCTYRLGCGVCSLLLWYVLKA